MAGDAQARPEANVVDIDAKCGDVISGRQTLRRVVADSTVFSRKRAMQSLQKYSIVFAETESTEELRAKLAEYYSAAH
jgi:hypothetical protein